MIKPLMIFLLGVSPMLRLWAQPGEMPKPRTIEVTGSAEMEIAPDEVYLSVTLREYIKDKSKVQIESIDKKFRQLLSDLKIDMKNVSLEGANAYYDWDYWRNKQTDFLASKTYVLKLSDLSAYNSLMSGMDRQGIQHAYLRRTDHSRIEEFRKQVKVEALKAAKEKARLLLEAIGEQTGEVLFIREVNQNDYPPMYKAMANMAMDAESMREAPQAEMQKIKLRYEVEAHFRIK